MKTVEQHVDDALSGYIDGELTQQDRQRVELHCQQCDTCRGHLDDLLALRERMGQARLSPIGEDRWRETMNDSTVKSTRSIGWILFLAGCIGVTLLIAHALFIDAGLSVQEKFLFGALYGGLGLLLVSVIRQRWIESKTDKYNDVEI